MNRDDREQLEQVIYRGLKGSIEDKDRALWIVVSAMRYEHVFLSEDERAWADEGTAL